MVTVHYEHESEKNCIILKATVPHFSFFFFFFHLFWIPQTWLPHTHHILLKFLSCISHVASTCEREHFISSVLASERHYRRDPWPCFVPYSVSFFLLILFCRLVQWLQHLIRPWSFFQVLRGLFLLSWKLGELIYTYTVSVVWLLYYNESR